MPVNDVSSTIKGASSEFQFGGDSYLISHTSQPVLEQVDSGAPFECTPVALVGDPVCDDCTVSGWSTFTLGSSTYLAASVFKSKTGLFGTDSVLFHVTAASTGGMSLKFVAKMPTTGAKAVTAFVQGSRAYIAFANLRGESRTTPPSTLWSFNGQSVAKLQDFNAGDYGATDVDAAMVTSADGKNVYILAFANTIASSSNSGAAPASKIFSSSEEDVDSDGVLTRWTPQTVTTSDASAVKAFQVGKDAFLIFANGEGTSAILRRDPVLGEYLPFQTILSTGAAAVDVVQKTANDCLLLIAAENGVDMYTFDTNYGATGVAPFRKAHTFADNVPETPGSVHGFSSGLVVLGNPTKQFDYILRAFEPGNFFFFHSLVAVRRFLCYSPTLSL